MSYIPHLLDWPTALIAAGITIPALLLLYFLKLRRREMAVSSTILWRKAIQDLQVNAPFQRLRRNLLLLLQLLILLLLLLALSRPVSNYSPGPGKTTVILIDRSASMGAADVNGRTRLEEAKRLARDLVAGMKHDGVATVIAFDETAENLQPFTSDQTLLRNAIDSIQQTDRPTDLRLAYQLAGAQINFKTDQVRISSELDVRLYSDGRVPHEDELRLPATTLTYERLGNDQSANVGIVALSAKRNYERPTDVQVFGRLANYGPEPVTTGVTLSIDGEKVDTGGAAPQEAFLLPERWTDEDKTKYEDQHGKRRSEGVQFSLKLTQGAVLRLTIDHRDGDVLAADDVAQLVIPPPKTLSALLVTDSNVWLIRAVKSLNLNKPLIISPDDYRQKYKDAPPKEFDVILYDNFLPPADPNTHLTMLPTAGNFVWFGKVPLGIKTKVFMDTATSQPAGGAPPGGNPVILDDVYVLDWKRDHPILQNLNLNKLWCEQALKLKVPLDQEVLVDGLKGPMVVLDREGKQTHLILAFDVVQSNWPLLPSFPIFMDKAMHFIAAGSDMSVRQSVSPGTAIHIPRSSLLQAGDKLTQITVKGPNGNVRVSIPATGDFVLPALDRVGVYTTDPPVPQYEQIAVNLLDANESNILPNPQAPGKIGQVESSGGVKSRLELWRWLAFAGLAMLMIEWWVYTRRVHL